MKTFDEVKLQDMNTIHISEHIGQYEAARNSFFVFAVNLVDLKNDPLLHPDVDPNNIDWSQSAEDKAKNSDFYNPDQTYDYIRLNVTKASVPNFTVEVKEYRRGNDVIKFAGVPTFAEGSLTVDDVVGLHTKDLLYAWLYKAYNPISRAGGRMVDYKKNCTLMEYTQDYQLIRTWDLQGCFITGITEGEFDRESDDKRSLQVAISYDRAIMHPEYDVE